MVRDTATSFSPRLLSNPQSFARNLPINYMNLVCIYRKKREAIYIYNSDIYIMYIYIYNEHIAVPEKKRLENGFLQMVFILA